LGRIKESMMTEHTKDHETSRGFYTYKNALALWGSKKRLLEAHPELKGPSYALCNYGDCAAVFKKVKGKYVRQPDAGQPDAGQPDAGQPDAGQPDMGALLEACKDAVIAMRTYGTANMLPTIHRLEKAIREAKGQE
jgi:hypothetical protein